MFKLPAITYPLTVDTIGKALAMGTELTAHCETRDCNHRSRINLVALASRLGMDHSIETEALQRHFFCPVCRAAGRPAKRIGFSTHPLTAAHSNWPQEPFRPEMHGR